MLIVEEQVLVGLGLARTVKSGHIEPSMLGGDILTRIHKALDRAQDSINNRRREVLLMQRVSGDIDSRFSAYLQSCGSDCSVDELQIGEITRDETMFGVTMKLEDDIMATIIPKLVNDGVVALYIEVSCDPKGFATSSVRREEHLRMVFDAFCTSKPNGYFD